jgi:hypothetical protein
MLLIVSGASGVGKTTARLNAAPLLGPQFEPVELGRFGPVPATPTVAWRQETVERIAQHAIELGAVGRHVLLAGDPIPAGEALAVPSADRLDIAVCLLDLSEAEQNARLDTRHDPPEMRHLHLAFAEWMRRHAVDPTHLTEVVTNDSWPRMQWDRWVGADVSERWAMSIIDGSALSPEETGAAIAQWAHAATSGRAPVFSAGWFR